MDSSITPQSRGSTSKLCSTEVRDLEWALQSPNLLEGPSVVTEEWCKETLEKHRESLLKLDENPEPLRQYLAKNCRSHRLGIYFEALISYWLSTVLKVDDLHQNTAIRQNGVTLGEFDFLFKDPKTHLNRHWETAVKFYLYYPQSRLYYGPNAKDRLDIKLSKIFDHQLKLSEHLEEEYESKAFVKGTLFYPHVNKWISWPAPAPIAATHTRGWWLRLSDKAFESFPKTSKWLPLERRQWLSPQQISYAMRHLLLNGDEIVNLASQAPYVMLAEFEDDGSGFYVEKSRGFIVRDTWPNC